MAGIGDVARDAAKLFRERPAIVVGAGVLGLVVLRMTSGGEPGDEGSDGTGETPAETGVGAGTFGLGYGPGLGGTGLYSDGGSIDYGYGGDLPGPGVLPTPTPISPPLLPGPPIPVPSPTPPPASSRPAVAKPKGAAGYYVLNAPAVYRAVAGAGTTAPTLAVSGPAPDASIRGSYWVGPVVNGKYGRTARRRVRRLYSTGHRAWTTVYIADGAATLRS